MYRSNEMATPSRKNVEVPDKAWLDALKFLMGPQWLKMRFVTCQLYKVVKGNISELPRVNIDSVKFWETSIKSNVLVASDVIIPSSEKQEWFMKHGIKLDTPTDLSDLKDALVGNKAPYGYQHETSTYYCAEINEMDEAGEAMRSNGKMVWQKLHASYLGSQENHTQVIFFADFNPDLNEYSWPSMEYFLNLLYNPFTYIEKVEMYALNANLTDALFLGEDYGSYIHCGKFTMRGDFCKSLPYVQNNVRAETIYFPGRLTDFVNSYTKISNLVLDTSWKCASKKIRLGMIYQWKWFVNILIKKFQTLRSIEQPMFEFSFCQYEFDDGYEMSNLNFLVWYPEVVKLKSEYRKTVYVVSNGRNRMEIAIFPKDNEETSSRTKYYNVSVKTYTIQYAPTSRVKVYISNDTWLEAFKFLKCPEWSKALFASRQLAGLVQVNILRLPCIVIDSATMSQVVSNALFVSFGDKIPADGKQQFFTNLGIPLDAPANLQHEDAVIGCRDWNYVEMCLRCTEHGMNQSKTPFIFSARCKQHKEYYWAALQHFVKFLYSPALYTKEVAMFALNQKMIDTVFDDEERLIYCGSFTWKREAGVCYYSSVSDMDEIQKSLSWLERNVRANTIHFPGHIDYKNKNIYESMANFLLEASWMCARQEVNLKCLCNVDSFVKALLEKFRSLSFFQNKIPTFMASAYGNDETLSFLLLDPDVKKLKPDDSQSSDEYLISNGDNRMQIEIFKQQVHDIHGYQTNAHATYHDNWRNYHQFFRIYVKLYTV